MDVHKEQNKEQRVDSEKTELSRSALHQHAPKKRTAVYALSLGSVLLLCFSAWFFIVHQNKQKSRDYYKALKRIEALTESGTSYSEYSKTVSDVMYEKNIKTIPKDLISIFELYQAAKDAWRANITNENRREVGKRAVSLLNNANLEDDSPYSALFSVIKVLSKLDDEAESKGIKFSKETFHNSNMDSLIQILWHEARVRLKKCAPEYS